MKYAETIDFEELRNLYKVHKVLYDNSIDYDIQELQKKLQFDKNAINRKLKELENTDFEVLDYIIDSTFCRNFFYDHKAVFEFARLEFLCRLANWGANEQSSSSNKQLTHPQKIVLLDKLGFFKLEKLTHLTNRQKEKIISMLINEDETNTRKYINGITSKEKAGNYNPYKNSINENSINELLS